jgi:hypothetical protein
VLLFPLLVSCDTLDEVNLSNEAPPTYVKPVYRDNGDGTISDTTSNGIMWAKCAHGETGTASCSGSADKIIYSTAYAYCENLTLAGYTDWRLPTVAELETLGFSDGDYSWFTNYTTLKSEYWFSGDLENNVFVYSVKLSTKETSKTASDSTITRYARCARAIQP